MSFSVDICSSRHSITPTRTRLPKQFWFNDRLPTEKDHQSYSIMFKETKNIRLVVNNMIDFINGFIKIYPNIISPHTNPTSTYAEVYHRIDTSSHAPTFAKVRKNPSSKKGIFKISK